MLFLRETMKVINIIMKFSDKEMPKLKIRDNLYQ